MRHRFRRSGLAMLALAAATCVSGCATAVKPTSLPRPTRMTCIDLPQPLAFTGHYGLFHVAWTTRLERGPYWSERSDGKGTYYRAPPGGVQITTPGTRPGFGTSDGGFYMPDDPAQPVRIYRYFSTASVTPQVPPQGMSCATLRYVQDPKTSKVSVAQFAAAGAVGGLIGRSLSRGSTMSYGQSAGVGLAGGLIGGMIVAAMINADVGKIVPGQAIQDPAFMHALRELATHRVALRKAPAVMHAKRAANAGTPSASEGPHPETHQQHH